MSSSNCCFLTCIQISQEAGKVVWYSHLLKNIPQFAVIHTVKGFGVVNKAEIDAFLELSCFFDDPTNEQQMNHLASLMIHNSMNTWKYHICKKKILLYELNIYVTISGTHNLHDILTKNWVLIV